LKVFHVALVFAKRCAWCAYDGS